VPAADKELAETTRHKARAFCAALVSVSVKVATLATKFAEVNVAIPTIACSIAVPILVFVVAPQVPDCSPVVISSNFRLENVLDIWSSF
jgi:hypothetical protein